MNTESEKPKCIWVLYQAERYLSGWKFLAKAFFYDKPTETQLTLNGVNVNDASKLLEKCIVLTDFGAFVLKQEKLV